MQAKVPGRRGVYIRTGDLGFFDKSGELYVTGRSKDLIIIRGRNHAPEDIEYSVQSACKFLRPGCIAAIAAPTYKKASKMSKSDDLNGDTLCVIAEVRDGVDKGTAQKDIDNLVQTIPQRHGITCDFVAIVPKGSLPKTTSGKLRRGKAREMLGNGAFKMICSKGKLLSKDQGTKKDLAPSGEMRANAIFPRYGYDTILRKLDNAGRLASLEDRLIAYFQNVCGIKTIKAENNVLDMGVDSIALVRLQNTLNLSLNLEISPSVLFENPAPRVMAERLRLSFEAQNPVVVDALKFNTKDKMQITEDVSDKSATFLSVLSTLQKSLVWIALVWLVYQCYMDMVNRNIRWWSQPKYIF